MAATARSADQHRTYETKTGENRTVIELEVDEIGLSLRYATVSDLIVAATMREVRRLQRKHNAGKKWPGVPSGALRRGRRTREEIRRQNAEHP